VLTQERLKEILRYDPETGLFTRLEASKQNRRFIGTVAGSCNGKGYVFIRVEGRLYAAHRLATLYMTGEWPKAMTDHRNTITNDNRWENIRPATNRQNQHNRGPRSDSSTGLKLIQWYKPYSCYTVRMNVDGKKRHFGYFSDLPSAIDAAAQVMLTFCGDFARVH
jgi:hypothetical protein